MSALVGIELFAGSGGLSTGLLDGGFTLRAGSRSTRAVDAYDYNHAYRGSRGYVADPGMATWAELLTRAGIARAAFEIGGPPCQSSSVVGKRKRARPARELDR